ncbi:hypothetical protein, partial [Cloacibacillus sp.]
LPSADFESAASAIPPLRLCALHGIIKKINNHEPQLRHEKYGSIYDRILQGASTAAQGQRDRLAPPLRKMIIT